MKKVCSELLKEEYYFTTLANGLRVFLMPKTSFYRTYALFGTRFGSIDQEFIPLGQKQYRKVPAGVAHFLEHKTFECEDGSDASDLFAQLGADVNAYTSYDRTVYLFSATSNISEATTTLLDFVQSPYFTKENVDKEQGIIEQELLMYLDKPDTDCYVSILKNLYFKNYIREDIGGTVSSIKEIDKEVLDTCYNTFYHPSNMTLVLVGNFDYEELLKVITDNQNKKKFALPTKVNRRYYTESNLVHQALSQNHFDVIIPKIACGIKFAYENLSDMEIFKNSIMLEMLLDMYFDHSSDNYQTMLKQGIIDNSFDYDSYYEKTFAHAIFTVDTNKVEKFQKFMEQALLAIKDTPIKEEVFKRYKRLDQASTLYRFNSLEYIANLFIEFDFSNLEMFEAIETKNNITIAELEEFKKQFVKEAISFHIITK